MANMIDLTGQRFGRLVVIELANKKGGNGSYHWLCKCDCGNEKIVRGGKLKEGDVKSCGCLMKENGARTIKNNSAINRIDFKEIKERSTETYKEKYVIENTNIKNLDMDIRFDNSSGFKGISWNKKRGTWQAYITFKKKRIHLGWFKNKQDAINVRKEAEEKYFKPMLEKYGTKKTADSREAESAD